MPPLISTVVMFGIFNGFRLLVVYYTSLTAGFHAHVNIVVPLSTYLHYHCQLSNKACIFKVYVINLPSL